MSEKVKENVTTVLVALLTVLVIMLCVVLPLNLLLNSDTSEPEPTVRLQVEDTPLLTPEQKKEALETDSVAFKVGDENIVIQYGAREALKDYL